MAVGVGSERSPVASPSTEITAESKRSRKLTGEAGFVRHRMNKATVPRVTVPTVSENQRLDLDPVMLVSANAKLCDAGWMGRSPQEALLPAFA